VHCRRSVDAGSWPPRTAVILAAGHGSRLAGSRAAVPKPLLRVAGLGLLERSILTLRAAGIDEFRVVVGAERQRIAAEVQRIAAAHGVSAEVVECPDFDDGNGVSLAAGARGLTGGFLVAMADHVMDTAFVREFLAGAAGDPGVPQVAADLPGGVFDLDDATKILTADGGRIVAIGKQLDTYDAIDAGLFYFPPRSGDVIRDLVASGARSVSDVVTRIAQARSFHAIQVGAGLWQDVDTPAMAREAERRLLRSLAKPTDGFVSRHLNRPLSIALSRHLARWGVRPNAITTVVFAISLFGAFLAQTADPLLLAAGGLLFQLASILDGCDGEVSRLKFQGTRWGGWYDTVSDNVRYMAFYAALGVAAYRMSGAEIYLWALVPFLTLSIFFVATMARYTLTTQTHYTNLAVTDKVLSGSRTRWWERLVLPLNGLIKQDVQALVAMIFCLVGLPGPYFWLTVAGAIAMTVSVVRGLGGEAARGARARVFLFYAGGLLLLTWLVSRMPFESIHVAFQDAGAGLLLVFATAPLWYAANATGLGLLLEGRVGFRHLFHNQMVGEAMNTIVPLAGLGGDVFRARHLATLVGAAPATRAVVQDRLIHALSGPLFAGAAIALTVWLVPLEPAVAAGLAVTAALLLAAGGVLLAFMLTPYSSRWSGALFRRLSRRSGEVTFEPPRRRLVLAVLAAKMAGRLLNLVEIALILQILGLEISPPLVIAIAGLLSASAVVFFMVPQGLGVNEAGIAGAFGLLGVAAPYGLAFGLIRRARVVTWAALGLALQTSLWGWKRLRARRPAEAALADGA
jgi:1L-myo-inositol 1-phosphate cytidylyltransferase / CDP-L-myo-inositol myo-inositolphosphotransferase